MQEFAAYTFSRGRVTYRFDGFVPFDFTGTGVAGSGRVSIQANGVEVARVSATGGGFGVEVLNGGLPQSVGYLAARGGKACLR